MLIYEYKNFMYNFLTKMAIHQTLPILRWKYY